MQEGQTDPDAMSEWRLQILIVEFS